MRPLSHCGSDGPCDPKLARDLHITLTEVLGTSSAIAVGDEYRVRGEYVLGNDVIDRVVLSSMGRSSGRPAPLEQGAGTFEVTAEILAVEAGGESVLHLVMIGRDGSDLGVRTRIELAP